MQRRGVPVRCSVHDYCARCIHLTCASCATEPGPKDTVLADAHKRTLEDEDLLEALARGEGGAGAGSASTAQSPS